jgi:flagellar biogenesis protein FliO
MAFTDPMFLGMLAALLVFFFFVYLMIRRTVLGFREGYDRGQD